MISPTLLLPFSPVLFVSVPDFSVPVALLPVVSSVFSVPIGSESSGSVADSLVVF
jgi:hypothetical protein